MQIGKYNLNLLETGRFALDGGAMFGVVPKNLWSKAYPHYDEQNRIAMSARALLIRGEGKVIVVDAGCGHKLSEKQSNIYGLDYSEFTLVNSLAKHGLKPTDVTDFIYTHLHFDHAGGSTYRNSEGVLVPTFPNAKHYVQTEQLSWGRNPSDKDRASYMPENWEPVLESGLLQELEGRTEIFSDIELRPFYGHTQAMQIVVIKSDITPETSSDSHVKGIAYCADLIPTSAHVAVPYVMGYDNFPLTTIAEKKIFLQEATEQGWQLCFEHDAFSTLASLQESGKGVMIKQLISQEF